MITIFHGRKLSLDGTSDKIYAEVAVALRDKIHLFNNGKNLNPFGVFMCLALHADANGWAFPGRSLLARETGISTSNALSAALDHLRVMRINGHRVLAMYRQQDPVNKQYGPTCYRIFPDAFSDGTDSAPTGFRHLVPWRDGSTAAETCDDDPDMGNPYMGEDINKNNQNKYIQNEPEPANLADGSLENDEPMQEARESDQVIRTRAPDDDFRIELSEARLAEFYPPSLTARARAVRTAMETGMEMEAVGSRPEYVHERALVAARCCNDGEVPSAMPVSWYRWRVEHARKYSWSKNKFINSLCMPHKLEQHCEYQISAVKPKAVRAPVERSARDIAVDEYYRKLAESQEGELADQAEGSEGDDFQA